MITHALEDWLCVSTDESPILLVEPPIVKRSRREKFSEILFEKFKVPGLMMYKDAALTCFSRGRTMGMVVDMGEDFTRCCGVFDGFVDQSNVVMQRFGGVRLRNLYLKQCLIPAVQGKHEILPRGCVELSAEGKTYLYNAISREMNEKLSCVTENPYKDDIQNTDISVPFVLPDGHTIHVGKEVNAIPELMFFPTALGDPSLKSLQLLIADQLTLCSGDTTRDIASSVMLCGGVSSMKGLAKRLDRELSVMSNGAARLAPLPENENSTSAFLGASILASLGSFSEFIVTRAEYERVFGSEHFGLFGIVF